MTKPGDVDHFTRVRCYRALVDNYYEPGSVVLSLLPLAMRMAGPREVLLARDHPPQLRLHPLHRRPRPRRARQRLDRQAVLSLPTPPRSRWPSTRTRSAWRWSTSSRWSSCPMRTATSPVDEVPPGAKTADISGTEVREKYLAKGLQLPEWFSRPAVAEILNETNPPRFRQGLTLWFTGLSGSGKSTVAHALIERLAEFGRNCSLLDGDEIRTHLSKGLGFSKEDRDTNIRRVGYVAGLVAQHGGTTLCSVISPYRAIRDEARKMSQGQLRRDLLRAPRSTSANSATSRACTPRPARRSPRASPWASPALTTLTSRPRTPRSRSTPASSRSRSASTRIIDKLLALGLHPAARAYRRLTGLPSATPGLERTGCPDWAAGLWVPRPGYRGIV